MHYSTIIDGNISLLLLHSLSLYCVLSAIHSHAKAPLTNEKQCTHKELFFSLYLSSADFLAHMSTLRQNWILGQPWPADLSRAYHYTVLPVSALNTWKGGLKTAIRKRIIFRRKILQVYIVASNFRRRHEMTAMQLTAMWCLFPACFSQDSSCVVL